MEFFNLSYTEWTWLAFHSYFMSLEFWRGGKLRSNLSWDDMRESGWEIDAHGVTEHVFLCLYQEKGNNLMVKHTLMSPSGQHKHRRSSQENSSVLFFLINFEMWNVVHVQSWKKCVY